MIGDQASIRARRLAVGLTQVTLAELAGVSVSSARAAERGGAGRKTMAAIDAALARREGASLDEAGPG